MRVPMYETRIKPWAHQEEGLRLLEGKRAFALLMDMRTGKTKVTIDDFGRLEDGGEVQDLLVVAPAGVYKTWIKAVNEHAGRSLLRRLEVFCYSSGGGGRPYLEALERFMRLEKGHPRLLLVNVEALSTVKRAKELCIEFLTQRQSMLVIDESTSIKGSGARRAKFIVDRLAPIASYRRILTGLPTPQGPLDLFMQFYFLDWRILGHRTFHTFKWRYAVFDRKEVWMRGGPEGPMRKFVNVIVGYKNTEELAEKIAPHSYRVRLGDCYELPPKMYTVRDVKMTGDQQRYYAQIREAA